MTEFTVAIERPLIKHRTASAPPIHPGTSAKPLDQSSMVPGRLLIGVSSTNWRCITHARCGHAVTPRSKYSATGCNQRQTVPPASADCYECGAIHNSNPGSARIDRPPQPGVGSECEARKSTRQA